MSLRRQDFSSGVCKHSDQHIQMKKKRKEKFGLSFVRINLSNLFLHRMSSRIMLVVPSDDVSLDPPEKLYQDLNQVSSYTF